MRVRRRTLLIGSALTAGASLLPRAGMTAAAPAPRRPAFLRLPPGAVRPLGWLATQLDRQLTASAAATRRSPAFSASAQNKNSGKVLAIDGGSTADSAHVVQFADNGAADHRWRLVDLGNGQVKVANVYSGKVPGIDLMGTADSAHVVQFGDTGTADHVWRLL